MSQTEPENYSDEELAYRTAAGSGPYFDELIKRYSSKLFHFIRPKLETDEDTEDLLQEVFCKSYQNIQRYNPKWRFSTWIYTIANRAVVSYYRSSASQKNKKFPDETLTSTTENPEQVFIHQSDQENIWTFARSLKKGQFDTLWLRYVENLPVAEIARSLNMSQVYIRVLLHRGRQNLAKMMALETGTKNTNQEDHNVLSPI